MFWKRKKTGRLSDGPRPDLELPARDWAPFALAFHERANRVISVIMADDEAVLEPLPRSQPKPSKRDKSRVYREERAFGCRFDTDTQNERGYRVRFAGVRRSVSDEERAAYMALFRAWLAHHVDTGAIRRFEDEDGEQVCWKVGEDDVIGVRLEHLGSDIRLSATRAWVLSSFRHQFEPSNVETTTSADPSVPEPEKLGGSSADISSVYVSLMPNRSGAQAHPYSTRMPDRDNTKELADLLNKMQRFQPFDRTDLPQQLMKSGQMRVKRSALSTGFLFLDGRAVEIFRQHDLGKGFIWEMPVVGRDGAEIAGEDPWFGLHVGAVKDTLDPDASTAVKTAFGNPALDDYHLGIGEKHLVLSSEANSGPDVWRERHLTGHNYFFLSSRLRDALDAAGLATDFDLIACSTTSQRKGCP